MELNGETRGGRAAGIGVGAGAGTDIAVNTEGLASAS